MSVSSLPLFECQAHNDAREPCPMISGTGLPAVGLCATWLWTGLAGWFIRVTITAGLARY